MDLSMVKVLRWSQTWFPTVVGVYSPNPCLCLLWLGQCAWSTCWRLRQKSCQVLQPSNVLDNQVSCFLLEKSTFSLAFLLSPLYLQKLFMMPFTSLARFNSIRYFSFPNLIPGCSDNIQFFCIPPRLHFLASTLFRLPFCFWVFQEMLVPSHRCPGFFSWFPLCWNAECVSAV